MTNSKLEAHYIRSYNMESAVAEALRQTERHLEEQQKLAGLADQRSLAFAALLVVVMSVMIAGTSSTHAAFDTKVTLVLFFVSFSLSVYAARPMRVFGSGGTKESLSDYLREDAHGYLLIALADRNDSNIRHNDEVIRKSAFIFRVALAFAGLAVLLLVSSTSGIIDQALELLEAKQ